MRIAAVARGLIPKCLVNIQLPAFGWVAALALRASVLACATRKGSCPGVLLDHPVPNDSGRGPVGALQSTEWWGPV